MISVSQEMIELLRESVIHMLHTRDGAHVGMHCLWHGTAKDRKVSTVPKLLLLCHAKRQD